MDKTNFSETNNTTDKNITLSVVMPAYNEGAHIYDNLLEASRVMSTFLKHYEIIAVNDGSKDNTADLIRKAAQADTHIKPVIYDENKGKGGAICTGIPYASGHYIAILDSDLELPPILLKRFLKQMHTENCDILIGSKLHPQSKLNYPPLRKFMSYGYYIMLKLLFHLNIHDTQTGIKLYKSEVIKPIAENLQTTGYAFDIEILAKANAMRYIISEAPIELNYSRDDAKSGRRIGLKDVFKVFKDTLAVKRIIKHIP